MANEEMTKASPPMWKAKQIDSVFHSSKDAETLAMTMLLDEITYVAKQMEMIMYGNYTGRMKVKVYTDSEPLLESVALTKQVARKGL